MLLRELDQPLATLARERPPARILEGRDRVEEGRRRTAVERPGESVGVETLVVHLDGGHLDSARCEKLQRPVVGRPFDEDAGTGDAVGQEGQPLERAVREQHACGLDAVSLCDPLAQRLVAADRAVGEDGRAVPLDHRPRAVAEELHRDAFRRGNSARERDRLHATECTSDVRPRPLTPAVRATSRTARV